MKRMLVAVVVSLIVSSQLLAQDQPAASIPTEVLAQGKLIDLTHPFNEKTIYWPTEDGFRLQVRSVGFTQAGYYYAANAFSAAEHGGTHLDAPIHFYKGRQTAEQIPLTRLIGPAVVVDVTKQCAEDRDYQVGVADLRAWEEKHGRQLVDVIVLIRTGYHRFWSDRKAYLGTDQRGPEAVAQLHFPGLDPDAARWLTEQRMVRAVGIDTASIDYGQSRTFGSHVKLFQHNVPVFENVAEVSQLPEKDFWVIALPMKIAGGSGGPLRIVAVVPSR